VSACGMGMACVLRPHQLARCEAANEHDTGLGAMTGRVLRTDVRALVLS
jgi:hypothetical protein